jgi:cation:H+ antiporter
MPAIVLCLLFVFLGLLLLYLGGEALIRGSSSLAFRLGLSSLVIGLTVVAFGTSMPELFVSMGAVLEEKGNIAVGNVIGSNIFNIAFILGITAILCPLKIQRQLMRWDVPIMVIVSIASIPILWNREVSRAEGFLLFTLIILYTTALIRKTQRSQDPQTLAPEFEQTLEKPKGSIWFDIGYIATGLALLIGGSHFLIEGSVGIARWLSISEAIIGLTIVAGGTSLPEIATSIVAAIRKEPDIALGNIVGSNIFNILAILGLTGAAIPFEAHDISSIDITVMIAFAFVLLIIVLSGKMIKRWHGCLLLLSYALYLTYLWPH